MKLNCHKNLFAIICFAFIFAISQIATSEIYAQGSAVEEPPALQEPQSDETPKPQEDESLSTEQDKVDQERADNDSDQDQAEEKADQDKGDLEEPNSDEADADESGDEDSQENKDKSADEDEENDEAGESSSESLSGRVSTRNRYSKRNEQFLEVFDPIIASASASTAIIYSGRRQVAMGTVVDSDGLILTKASELRNDLKCKLPDGKSYDASVLGVDPATDLALLKIVASQLPTIEWSNNPSPTTGHWVATPNQKDEPLAVGVISVNEREILPSRPFIGIQMLPTENNVGVRITRVIPGTPADRSDILVNDVVIKLDDIEISDQESLRDNIGQYSIGDVATLTVKRGKKEMKIRLILADEENLNPQFDRSRQQNSMGSTLSKRRKDFPLAFQHDSMLDAKNCGGPIVDLDGRVVGINIARDGRVSSLALPRSIVEPVVERLKTGNFSPAVVNAERLKKVDTQLQEIYAKLEELPGKKESLERTLSVADARTEELQRMLEDIEARLKMIKEKTSGDREELESISDELESFQSAKRRLEKQRKNLELGSQ